MLKTCNKPVIGHNMIYDLAFLYHQFEEPLPNEFSEWQSKTPFNTIYDTKVMANEVGNFGKTEL